MTGELYVYDSRGQALHPPNADAEPRMESFFDERVAGVMADPPAIEIYGKVRTENQREQVSFRFFKAEGESYEKLFEDFVGAIENELVKGREWDFPAIQNGPGKLFKQLFSDPPNFDRRTNLNNYFNFANEDFAILERLAKRNDAQSTNAPHIKARSYKDIAKILPHVVRQWGDPVTVSRRRYVAPDTANVHFTVNKTQRAKFTIANDTQEAIDSSKQQLREQQKNKKLDSLTSDISELNAYGASTSEIKQKLNSSFQGSYPNLTIRTQQEISDLKSTSKRPRELATHTSQSTSTAMWLRVVLFVMGSVFGGLLTALYNAKEPAFWWELNTILQIVSVAVPVSLVFILAIFYLSDISLLRWLTAGRAGLRILLVLVVLLGVMVAAILVLFVFNGGGSPEFEISNIEYDSEIETGNSLTVVVTINNTGDGGEDTVDVGFSSTGANQNSEDQLASDNETIQIGQGTEITEEFDIQVPLNAGEYNLTVSTSSDERTESVAVVDPFFSILELDLESPVQTNQNFNLTIRVENPGINQRAENISVGLEDETVSDEPVEIPAGNIKREEFSLSAPGEAGEYEITVVSDNNSRSENLVVEEDGEGAGGDGGETENDGGDEVTQQKPR